VRKFFFDVMKVNFLPWITLAKKPNGSY